MIILKGVYSWNKVWSLESLAMLKCESRTSLHAVQYKRQPSPVLMYYSCEFKDGGPRHFVFMVCGTSILALFLACS